MRKNCKIATIVTVFFCSIGLPQISPFSYALFTVIFRLSFLISLSLGVITYNCRISLFGLFILVRSHDRHWVYRTGKDDNAAYQ
jgi:hypothetical protein